MRLRVSKEKYMPRTAIRLQTGWRFTLLLAIPVVVGLVMLLVAREAGRRADLVKHTVLVELSLERLTSDLQEAENAQHEFLMTGETAYLESYRLAAGQARRELDLLGSLSITQKPAVARMRPLVDSQVARMEDMVQQYRAGRLDAAAAKAGIDRGNDLTKAIASLAGDMLREEERLLHAREIAFANTSTLFSWSLAAGYGLIVLLVVSLHRGVLRYSRQTVQAEQRLSLLNTKLDQRVRERTAMLEGREELLKIFVKYVPAAMAMFDRDMRYLQVSDRWCLDYSLDSSRILGRPHYEVFPDLPERWKEIHRRCLAGETLKAEADRWDRAEGSTTWLHWEIRPWGNKANQPEGILIFTEDITRRKQMEELLRESDATTRALLETAAQAILAIDAEGKIRVANRRTSQMFGYGPDELLEQPHDILLPERFRATHGLHRAEFLHGPSMRPMGNGIELWGLRKDGSEFPIEVNLSSVETSRGALAVSFVSDITARKRAETALRDSEQQLRELAGSLLSAQEDERRRLARELHDDITQRLAFLSIELGKLAGEIPETLEDPRAKIRGLQAQTLRTSDEVRRLSHGLHPSVIEDFGLGIALEEFCQDFERTQGVHVIFEGLVEDSRLDVAGATGLYRVAQESLRNAVAHGRATEIHVELSAGAGVMQLRVTDNGIGFATDGPPTKAGLGVPSMRERIRLLNGTLALSSVPGQGTEVRATVPLSGAAHDASARSIG